MSEMGEKKQLVVNMAAALVTFAVQVGINFILTPYITTKLGAEAYGFVNLSNTMVNYITILTVAITSMASRFISIALFRDDKRGARAYYSSTLATLVACVVAVAVPALVCIFAIDKLLNISAGLVGDVKLLMLFVLANFSLSISSSNLSIGFYTKNMLYVGSIINAIGHAIRALCMVILFALLPTSVSIVGFAAFAATSFVQGAYFWWKRKLLPDLRFSMRDVDPARAAEVAKAGAWNSVSQLGSTLSSGLDLIVCNLLLGGAAMGTLSVSRVIRSAIDSIGGATMSAFQPTLTKYYAANDIDGLVAYAKWAMKSFGLVIWYRSNETSTTLGSRTSFPEAARPVDSPKSCAAVALWARATRHPYRIKPSARQLLNGLDTTWKSPAPCAAMCTTSRFAPSPATTAWPTSPTPRTGVPATASSKTTCRFRLAAQYF